MPNPETKASLRRDLKAKRANIKDKDALDVILTERLSEWLRTRSFSSVFSYLSTHEEASTLLLVQQLLDNSDCLLSCPKILNGTTMIAVEFSSVDELEMGAHGIFTAPASSSSSSAVDIALVPGLGFTEEGDRLGYGAGYYDRWFESHPEVLKVALCYECQVLPSLPTEIHDVRMDFVVTEQSVRTCGN